MISRYLCNGTRIFRAGSSDRSHTTECRDSVAGAGTDDQVHVQLAADCLDSVAGAGTDDQVHRAICTYPSVHISICPYLSTVAGAGTDDQVHIQLAGEAGTSSKLPLAAGPAGFEPGAADEFSELLMPLGPLQTATLSKDGRSTRSQWHLSRVEVTEAPFDGTQAGAPTATYTFLFRCGARAYCASRLQVTEAPLGTLPALFFDKPLLDTALSVDHAQLQKCLDCRADWVLC